MNFWKKILIICAIIVIGCPFVVFAQSFGKNKVQYKNFNWNFIQSKHFDVYFYSGGIKLAEFTADVAESSYVALNVDMKYKIQDRIPILIYNSHNDFQQTNATYSLLEESVGGFTEIFKNRIVVPFQGDYDEFRHVIHHELTHAVTFQMFYSSGSGSMVMNMARFQMPLWLLEGLAEYESLGWDSSSDMYMRDATLNNYVPPISYLSGFLVYKGGQSLLNFIEEKYGRRKIAELLNKIKISRNVEKGFKKSIGIDIEELSKRWHKYLQKLYWPDIKDRDEPEDVFSQLTDHVKDRNFVNNSPSICPNGDKIVYLSNKSGYFDIYIKNLFGKRKEKKLIKGQRSDLFEQLHWTRPGFGWSPDGSCIVFISKAGSDDALNIFDVENKKLIKSYYLNLDGLFSPDWSPDGDNIVFMGFENGESNLYIYNLKEQSLKKLTDDIFSDLDPVWSPDGNKIAFVSDRGSYFGSEGDSIKMQQHEYNKYDLYTIDVDDGEMSRHTFDEYKEVSPCFSSDGKKIAYISDYNGINNVFIMDWKSNVSYPLTNLITGVSQISWSRNGSRLALSSFFNGGYDIYLLNNPLDIEPGSVKLENTGFRENGKKQDKPLIADRGINIEDRVENGYRNFVFRQFDDINKEEIKTKQQGNLLKKDDYKNLKGSYKINKYKIKFSPDAIMGQPGYSNFFGLQGTSTLVLSDILGNHNINIYADIFYSIKNSNLQLSYFYLPKRVDFGGSIFHYSYPYYTYFVVDNNLYWGFMRNRQYGLAFSMSRPFNKYKRIDFGITGVGITRDLVAIDYYGYSGDFIQEKANLLRKRIILLNLGYTSDTVIWGITGPSNGGRSSVSFSYSPSFDDKYGLDFWTLRFDWRKYIRIKRDYQFALRFSGGVSGGDYPQQFILGGMSNWINYQYKSFSTASWNMDNYFFSSLETPLRGARYYEMVGSRFFLTNLEFRFPLLRYLVLGPIPIGFQNIRGAMFMDIGSAWSEGDNWDPIEFSSKGMPRFKDVFGGFGFGTRLNMGFLLLKYDMAWSTNLRKTLSGPIYYLTMGAEF